jgi:anti-anti-sigma factor
MTLDIKVKQTQPGVVTVTPAGPINAETHTTLSAELDRLLKEPIKTLVLDMAEVDFISSVGVGLIVKTKTTLTRRNGDLAMINMQQQVKKVFEVIRLLPTLNVFESVKELDDYLARLQQHILDGDA